MKQLLSILTAFLLFSATANASNHKLSCTEADQSKSIELRLLKQAPYYAARISSHVLKIKFTTGDKIFTDKPPYEELNGVRWTYCGYDKASKIHLIGKSVDDIFTGIILFDRSGKMLNAGHTVIISPNKYKYLAIEQRNGRDGEDWTVMNFDGKKLWSGYAGIIKNNAKNNYESVVATFENPNWNNDSNLTAQANCIGSTNKKAVSLINIGDLWEWAPIPKCE